MAYAAGRGKFTCMSHSSACSCKDCNSCCGMHWKNFL